MTIKYTFTELTQATGEAQNDGEMKDGFTVLATNSREKLPSLSQGTIFGYSSKKS